MPNCQKVARRFWLQATKRTHVPTVKLSNPGCSLRKRKPNVKNPSRTQLRRTPSSRKVDNSILQYQAVYCWGCSPSGSLRMRSKMHLQKKHVDLSSDFLQDTRQKNVDPGRHFFCAHSKHGDLQHVMLEHSRAGLDGDRSLPPAARHCRGDRGCRPPGDAVPRVGTPPKASGCSQCQWCIKSAVHVRARNYNSVLSYLKIERGTWKRSSDPHKWR